MTEKRHSSSSQAEKTSENKNKHSPSTTSSDQSNQRSNDSGKNYSNNENRSQFGSREFSQDSNQRDRSTEIQRQGQYGTQASNPHATNECPCCGGKSSSAQRNYEETSSCSTVTNRDRGVEKERSQFDTKNTFVTEFEETDVTDVEGKKADVKHQKRKV